MSMHLAEIHIQGFKSFARRSDLVFTTPVTAIVGPNGSGKSNVAEALRFVLGEQSVKSLRGKRGEDLIWGGSDAIARANRASVKAMFRNEDRSLPLDTDTITIERIVHRDGQNEYKLNEQTVRLKDVHELLAAGNIGPSGHHIISQGEADRVLAASPLERRAMIEESLGLKVYQYKKQDAEKKLQKTEQNITAVAALRREIAPHLEYLKRELDKLSEARVVKTQLTERYAEYLRREDIYLAHRYDRLIDEQVVVQKQLQSVHETIATEAAAIANQETASEDPHDDTEQRTALQQVRQARHEADQDLSRAAGHLAAVREQLEVAETRATVVQLPLTSVQEAWQETSRSLQDLRAETSSQALINEVTQATDRFTAWLNGHDAEAVNSEDVLALNKKIQELEQRQSELQETAAALSAQEDAARAALESVQNAAQAAVVQREHATKALYEAKSQAAELQARLKQFEYELEIVARERQAFKDELQEAVALLGREASRYFEYVVVDEAGQPLPVERVYEESRQKQLERKRQLEKLKIKLETLGEGDVAELEQEYQKTKERDDFLTQEIADLEASVQTLQDLIIDLEQQIDAEFQAGFQRIETEFNSFFTLMFGGGKAGLELVSMKAENTELDADTEAATTTPPRGVELILQLPNKRVQGLAMLSGGERALTSIALIFAMSQVHPPLFIVLDETDAALDEANSRRYGDLIEALAERSQLVLITHNRETMSRAGTLYGVTMNATGASQLLSVQLADAVVNAK